MITRTDLLGLGYSSKAIECRIANGRLHPVTRGVYVVGRPQLSQKGRWMAAVLSCGEESALSHHSAAMLWGIGVERSATIDISVRRRCQHRRPGIRVRSRPALAAGDIVLCDRIPVTCPARTLVDLATEVNALMLERAVNEADKHDLIDPESLRDALDGFRGEPGVKSLRALLDRHTFQLSDAALEILFRPIAKEAGLPQPQSKRMVNGFEVDFFWPGLGIVVETDGLRYHRTPAAQSRDRLRDQTHTAAGLTTLRFTHHQVRYERNHVLRVLSDTARRIRR